jgi:hypothetical protein
MKFTIIFALLTLLVVGCADIPQQKTKPEQVWGSQLDHGSTPDKNVIVARYIKSFFKDPDSVKNLNIYDAHESEIQVLPLSLAETILETEHYPPYTKIFGYSIMFSCNAKNSYGGYAGVQFTSVFVRDGKIFDSNP